MPILKTTPRTVPYAVSVNFTRREFAAFQRFLKARRKKSPNRIPRIKEMLKEIILSAMIADWFGEEENECSVRSRREARYFSNA